MTDSIHDRGHALENMFCRQRDQELLKALKARMEAGDPLQALQTASGIEDQDVLKSLQEHGITASTLSTVGLIPLVAVAWADREMDQRESDAILRAAADSGIEADSPAHELLKESLQQRPDDSLFEAWQAYIGALKPAISLAAYEQLKSKVVSRCQLVADSAGGLLGIGTVSKPEKEMLAKIESTFA